MSRVCIINIAGLSMRMLGRCNGLWTQSLAGAPVAVGATFPAVSASVQASMTTGVEPGAHGVIAGGIFRRQCRAMSLDERSNTLLNKKRFWHGRSMPSRMKVSLLFWSNPLAGAGDYVIGASTYGPAARIVADVPQGLHAQIANKIGPFDAALVRGPGSSCRASEWITAAGEYVWNALKPDIQLVYLPGLNFEIIRHGFDSPQALDALKTVDALADRLAQMVLQTGGQVVLVSDGGYVPVSKYACPNRALRRAGLLVTKDDGNRIDLERSRAVALVDHQVAHVYCDDPAVAKDASAAIASEDGVDKVLTRDELFCEGLGHDRAGEVVVLSEASSWLCYQWWNGDAPPIAYATDTTAKAGYDPCELVGGEEGSINPDPSLCRASRGLITADVQDQCLIAGTVPIEPVECVTDLPDVVKTLLFMR